MEALLLLLLILLLLGEKDAAAALLGGMFIGGCIVVAGLVLVICWVVFPVTTNAALIVAAVLLLLVFCRWIYRRFFSKEARLKAAYKRMYERWYALSWQVVQLECGNYGWSLESCQCKNQKILARCLAEYERYKKLPPEKIGPQQKPYPYGEWIEDLQQRMQAAMEKFSITPKQS